MSQLNLELREPMSQIQINSQEKIDLELVSRQNIWASDVMGLSWIFVEDEEI